MTAVQIAGVGMTFPDGFTALRDVDVQVADGEFVALIGPSGSGKTTLLRLLAGFLSPTEGHVSIGGRLMAGPRTMVPPEQRNLGMVFQQHAIWPHMNVGQNVAYPLRFRKLSRTQLRERVTQVLAMVGLADFADRNPVTLSGGQRQRVALARALAAQPSVLLLDEALSALDEPLRDQLRVELTDLTRHMGLTVVHVTHDRAEALALADRIAVLDQGRVVQVGTPRELLDTPASPFVATFLSDATVFEGTWDGREFRATDHPLRLAGARVGGAPGPGAAQGVLAVLPQDVQLAPASTAVDAGHHRAEVRSSLFGRNSSDVIVDWAGRRVRSASTWQVPVGQDVQVQVAQGIFYPQEAGR